MDQRILGLLSLIGSAPARPPENPFKEMIEQHQGQSHLPPKHPWETPDFNPYLDRPVRHPMTGVLYPNMRAYQQAMMALPTRQRSIYGAR